MMGNTVQKGLWLDPRAKLFLILMCVLSSMFAPSLTYQFALVLLIAVLGVLCGKWKYAVKGVCFYAVVCVLTVWIMAAMTGTLRTMFVAFLGLFHKVYACGMLAGIVSVSYTHQMCIRDRINAVRFWNREEVPAALCLPLKSGKKHKPVDGCWIPGRQGSSQQRSVPGRPQPIRRVLL